MLTFRIARHGAMCVLGAFAMGVLGGCVASQPVNPSFPVTTAIADRVLGNAEAHPRPLRRPLVIVGGFVDPGVASNLLAMSFREYTGDERIIAVALDYDVSFGDYRRRIIDAVQKAFPSSDPAVTTRVDVIGYSMGGLAARYAAEAPRPGEAERRLRIARLFTISSPLSGAVVAQRMPLLLEPLQEHMRPGSRFLREIDQGQIATDLYPVYSYVCLGDHVVGVDDAAVPGQTAWWLSGPSMVSAHDWAFLDPRIRADIVCRLRGDKPLSSDPPTPHQTMPSPRIHSTNRFNPSATGTFGT